MRISVFYLANVFLSALVFSEGTILMPQRTGQMQAGVKGTHARVRGRGDPRRVWRTSGDAGHWASHRHREDTGTEHVSFYSTSVGLLGNSMCRHSKEVLSVRHNAWPSPLSCSGVKNSRLQ